MKHIFISFLILLPLLAGAQCTEPQGLRTTQVNVIDAAVAWNGRGAQAWELFYGQPGAAIDSMAQLYLTDSSAHLAGLAPATAYRVLVRALCGSDTSAFDTLVFTTMAREPVALLPFFDDFSNGLGQWAVEREARCPNQWVADTGATLRGSDRCLFVTSDLYPPYRHTMAGQQSTTTTTASRELLLEAGSYAYGFDWIAGGREIYHSYLRAFLEPGHIPLDGGAPLIGGEQWQRREGDFTVDSGLYRLCFVWSSSVWVGPPAAIDNVSLALCPCPSPTGLEVSASANSVTLAWHPGAGEGSWEVFCEGDTLGVTDTSYTFTGLSLGQWYHVGVRAYCGEGFSYALTDSVLTACPTISEASLPFGEGFDDGQFLACWHLSGSYPSTTYGLSLSDGEAWLTGRGSLASRLVLPRVDDNLALNELELTFVARTTGAHSSYQCPFVVVSRLSDPAAEDTLVDLDTLWLDEQPRLLAVPLHGCDDDSLRHLCLRTGYTDALTSGSFPRVILDTLTLHRPSCLRPAHVVAELRDAHSLMLRWEGWGQGDYLVLAQAADTALLFRTTSDSLLLTGLPSGRGYELTVRALCGAGDTSGASLPVALALPSDEPYYFCDFSQPMHGWTFVSPYYNNWKVGTLAPLHEGDTCLYMTSHPNSTAPNYSYHDSAAWAYTELRLPEGEYEYSFDWIGNGRSWGDCQFLRVFLEDSLGQRHYLDDGPLHGAQAWQNQRGTLSLEGGSYRLTCYYHCDLAFFAPAPAVDNILIRPHRCAWPTDLTLSTSQDTLFASWSGAAGQYELECDGRTFLTQDTSFTLPGLSIGESYTLRVRALCDSAEASLWTAGEVRTQCGAVALPFLADFDACAAGTIPTCWTPMQTNGNGDPSIVAGGRTGNALRISALTYMATPRLLAPANKLKVVFYAAKLAQSGAYVRVGFTPTLESVDSVVWVNQYINSSSASWMRNEVDFSSLGRCDTGYVVFLSTSTNTTYSSGIDDLEITLLPPCLPPAGGLSVENITSSSVTLSWMPMCGQPDSFDLAYGPAGFDPDSSSATIVTGLSGSQFTLTGLEGNETYQFYLRYHCDTLLYSDWTAPVSAYTVDMRLMPTTGCDTVTSCDLVIYDDGGPSGNYTQGCDGSLIVYPTEGNMLSFSGTMTCNYGTYSTQIALYDGTSATGTPILMCHASQAGTVAIGPYTHTSGGPVTVRFQGSPYVNPNAGFELFVTCQPAPCPPPVNLRCTQGRSDAVEVTWDDVDTPAYWLLEYGPAGFLPGQGTEVAVYSKPFTLRDLPSESDFDFYVRAVCSESLTSGRSRAGHFSTPFCTNAQGEPVVEAAEQMGYVPVAFAANYSISQSIYDTALLGTEPRAISAIGYSHYIHTGAPLVKDSVTIYFALTNKSRFDNRTDWVQMADVDFTKVYEGPFAYGAEPYTNLRFDEPFLYDGSGNLLVTVVDHSNYRSSNYDNFKGERMLPMGSQQGVSLFAAPTTCPVDSALSGSIHYIYYYMLPSTIFYTCDADTACFAPQIDSLGSPTYEGATAYWHGEGGLYEVELPSGEVVQTEEERYTFVGLRADSTYTFRLRQRCSQEYASEWVSASFTTTPVPPCDAPEGLLAELPDGAQALLSWQGDAPRYELHLWSHVGDTTYSVTGNSLSLSGLASPVEYHAVVRAVCIEELALSPWSDTLRFATDSCPMPTAVQVSDLTATTATLTWQGSAPSWTVRYGQGETLAEMADSLVVTTPTCTLEGLTPGTLYYVTLQAQCAPGWRSLHTPTITFRTDPAGISEAAPKDDLRIYPNPATDKVVIDFAGGNKEKGIGDILEIIDLQGRVVLRKDISLFPLPYTLHLQGLARGTYFVKCGPAVRKLVVQSRAGN